MAELPVERAVLEFVARVDRVAAALPGYRAYLADQMRRAATSAFLNLREALGEFSPREKARFFRMSARSIRETDGCLILSATLEPKTQLSTSARRAADGAAPQVVRLALHQQKRR